MNDTRNTIALYNELKEQISLREVMSGEYKTDLRSKSDAQIAESVIGHELERITGHRVRPPEILAGTTYHYRIPKFIRYDSPLMNWALDIVRHARFIVSENGNIGLPQELSNLELRIAGGVYRMGVGGLHSSEQRATHVASNDLIIVDRDVTSYYPAIILNLDLYPQHLGPSFTRVYRRIVERRVDAKRAGNKVVADSLKIAVNGGFGKLGNRFSIIYSPDLLIQVTLTGQLSLLMLIERLELQGITVASANTDGIVILCRKHQQALMESIMKQWEHDTGFETEETRYKALYSKDVNNYIAVKPDGKTKKKGVYAPTGLSKNPTNSICVEAVETLLTKGVPVEQTVHECRDLRKFVTVRYVKGGAVKDGDYLGKVVRWYRRAGETGEIVYAKNGNKVAKSDGAQPVMEMPREFPVDIDFDAYILEAKKILVEIGYSTDAS